MLALDASILFKWLYLRASTYVRYIGETLGGVLAAMVESKYTDVLENDRLESLLSSIIYFCPQVQLCIPAAGNR